MLRIQRSTYVARSLGLLQCTVSLSPSSIRTFEQNAVFRTSRGAEPARTLSSQSIAHNSLSSFLKHASSTSLSRSSTVFIGTLYEYRCQDALKRLGFSLERTGGAGDAGVDLAGTWSLPSLKETEASPLRAVVQCKALNRKTGPALVRELEGALASHGQDTVGVLCATKSATKGVRDALRNSRAPMLWLQIEQVGASTVDDGDDDKASQMKAETAQRDEIEPASDVRIRQMLWNEEVERIGARGMSVGLFRRSSSVGQDEDSEIALLWNGEIWQPD